MRNPKRTLTETGKPTSSENKRFPKNRNDKRKNPEIEVSEKW